VRIKSGYVSDSGLGPVAGCCEHGIEPQISTSDGEFLDQLSDY
jgi:hypothetical protein